MKALEDVLEISGWNPDTLILDRHCGCLLIGTHCDSHGSATGRIFHGVEEQIAERALQPRCIPLTGDGRLAAAHLNGVALADSLLILSETPHQRDQVDFAAVQLDWAPARQAIHLEKLANHLRHPRRGSIELREAIDNPAGVSPLHVRRNT